MPKIRFSLFALLVAVGVAGIAVRAGIAWVDAAKVQQRKLAALQASLDESAGLAVLFDHDDAPHGHAAPPRSWSDHLLHRVVAVSLTDSASDRTLEALCELDSLQRLCLSNCYFTAEARARLAALRDLRSLAVVDTEFTDEDLDRLSGMKRLRRLHLYQPFLTSEGLRRLEQCTQLDELVLVLDWEHFGGRPANQQRLQHALPSCRVQLLEPGDRAFWDIATAALHGR